MMDFNRLIVGTVMTGAASFAQGGLAYTFDSDDQGWTSINDTSFIGYDGSIGQPSGALRGVDRASGAIWFFAAPQIDLGDLSGLYGNSISYDILGISGNQTSISARADIMLSGGGLTIGINISTQPVLGQWTTWSAMVNDESGWEYVSSTSDGTLNGNLVSDSDIMTVLSDLDGLFIRGEYTNGNDSAALDNVSFVPAPGSLGLMLLAGLVSTNRRR